MANFWDLPRKIRDRIYRLHLVHDKPITPDKHQNICKKCNGPRISKYDFSTRRYPPILDVSKRADREAAPIYFGENHFEFSGIYISGLLYCLYPRHVRLIRKVTCDWEPDETGVTYGMADLKRLKGLEELNMKVDEAEMIRKAVWSRDRKIRQRWLEKQETYSAQEQLTLLHFPGMSGLMSLSGIKTVNFLKRLDRNRQEIGGAMPDGVLLTQVLPKITAKTNTRKNAQNKSKGTKQKPKKSKKSKEQHFDFLGLPAELRNRIYDLVLYIEGPLHPRKAQPTSLKRAKKGEEPQDIDSVLSILAVNKQIYDEALGIFYATPLVFYYPTQLSAFTLDLSAARLKLIKDVTVYYSDISSGGVHVVDICFGLLKQLAGLKRLQVLMYNELYYKSFGRWGSSTLEKANPGLLPGITRLFTLRDIADIKLRDLKLEEEFEQIKDKNDFPDFPGSPRNQCTANLTRALDHFNIALQDAQKGKVNTKLLEDNKWQLEDVYPTLEVEEEEDGAEEVEEVDGEDDDDDDEEEHEAEVASDDAVGAL